MSPRRSTPSGAGAGRAAVTALIVVAVAVGLMLLVRAGPDVESFDPRSSAGNGATGTLLLLRQVGADVTISASAPEPGADERVLVIADRLSDGQRAALIAFVEEGGVAVVADPASPLHGGGGVDEGAIEVEGGLLDELFNGANQLPAAAEANVDVGECTIPALQRLRGVYAARGLLFPVAGNQPHCLGDGNHAFVIVRALGEGVVVGLGDNNPLTNAYLRYADNAGLVTALLVPSDGAKVRIMIGSTARASVTDVGSGDERLVDLVQPGVWMALTQLALAFVVLAVARGVRAGRVVAEPQPLPIAGSELVVATGNLMQRARHDRHAGWLLRSELYRQLVDHYRCAADISVDDLCAAISRRRSDCDPAELRAVLLSDTGEAGRASGASGASTLLDLSRRIERQRTLLLTDAHPPTIDREAIS